MADSVQLFNVFLPTYSPLSTGYNWLLINLQNNAMACRMP